ncbi:MAG: hypothetical protein HYZ42_11880 [Bacteroidetes bacterium]|nr:hypothetical protein [Bacteroidota bacterium]
MKAEHSRRQAELVSNIISENKPLFDEFMQEFFKFDYVLKQRASWCLSILFELFSQWFEPYYPKLVDDFLVTENHPSIDRNISKIFTCVRPQGKDWEGILLDKAFKALLSDSCLPAVKCNAMCMILHFGEDYPEILSELKAILLSKIEFEKPSYISRANHVLRKLKN